MSQEFLAECHAGASTVQTAIKSLLDHDFITQDMGTTRLSDKLLGMWICQNM